MTCCRKFYDPLRIFEHCNSKSCARITVKHGQQGEVQIFDAPELFVFKVYRVVWDKCCKNPQRYPVKDDCNCDIVACSGMTIAELPAGDYDICICDEAGTPIVPDDGEVVAMFSQTPC